MLEVQIENIMPVADGKEKFEQLVDGVASSDDMYVFTKDGKPSATLVGIHHLEKLIPGENILSSMGAAAGAAAGTDATATPAPAPAETPAAPASAPFTYDDVTNNSAAEPQTTPSPEIDSAPTATTTETQAVPPTGDSPIANSTPDMSAGLNDDSFSMPTTAPTEPPVAPIGGTTDPQASLQIDDQADEPQPTNSADILSDANDNTATTPPAEDANQTPPPAAPQI